VANNLTIDDWLTCTAAAYAIIMTA